MPASSTFQQTLRGFEGTRSVRRLMALNSVQSEECLTKIVMIGVVTR